MNQKLLLGYDIGSSSIKASIMDADSGQLIGTSISPGNEMSIDSPQTGWAEQQPNDWWKHIVLATHALLPFFSAEQSEIIGIGIAYQMHGLVMVDKNMDVLSPAIIWCDSRAVEIGNKAFSDLGPENCLSSFLNSPGNFTASKLKWVKDNQPDVYSKIFKIMLPGDYIAMKLTGDIRTTISGLSEGIFWNFKTKSVANNLLKYYGIDPSLLPEVTPTFGLQGILSKTASLELGLKQGIPITYRAGDQPNNALSLNVFKPGEIAATAGTSGVVYGVTEKNVYDLDSRVNTFAHVNYASDLPRNGVLLCINGTGIQYRWLKQIVFENAFSYEELNTFAAGIPIGSAGLRCYPFGNGSERMLKNNNVHGEFSGIDFNIHTKGHVIRSAQEGIAFAFKYGLDIMTNMGVEVKTIKVGNTNLFQSGIFVEAFVNTCNVNVQVYNTDGSQGAARGAGFGAGYFSSTDEAFMSLKLLQHFQPEKSLVEKYSIAYNNWKIQKKTDFKDN